MTDDLELVVVGWCGVIANYLKQPERQKQDLLNFLRSL